MTWIILILEINSSTHAVIPFPDAMSCGRALPAIHDAVIQHYPDSWVKCQDSGIPKVRPLSRP